MEETKTIDINTLSRSKRFSILMLGFGLTMIVGGLQSFLHISTYLDNPNFPVWLGILLLLLSAFITIIVHEGLHGIPIWLFARKVEFGGKWSSLGPVFYATSAGSKFTKKQFIAILLAPQVLTLTLLVMLVVHRFGFPIGNMLLGCAAVNLGGGCADLYFTGMLLFGYKGKPLVEDTKTGMIVYKA